MYLEMKRFGERFERFYFFLYLGNGGIELIKLFELEEAVAN